MISDQIQQRMAKNNQINNCSEMNENTKIISETPIDTYDQIRLIVIKYDQKLTKNDHIGSMKTWINMIRSDRNK